MGDTPRTFTPSDGSIELRFVSGNDGLAPTPLVLSQSRLNKRFAVVQETYFEGCVDAYFDEALWRALLAFVVTHGEKATVIRPFAGMTEEPLTQFLTSWDRTDREDREPPWAALVRSDGVLALAMVTEYWVRIGGPSIYHDSYTYSLFSDHELGSDVINRLKSGASAHRWQFGPLTHIPPNRRCRSHARPRPFSRLLANILG
jgi:hypothetical protein